MKTSNLYALNYKDILKSLLIASISSALTVIQHSLNAGSLELNWKAVGTVALSSALAYLVKNFFTPAQLIQKISQTGQIES